MKTAMQNKDTARLSVLKSLMSQTLNASKTSSPINTDLQMLALLRKTANASKVAKAEFEGAGRQDLADKEASQLLIMEEYAGDVQTVGEEEILAAVNKVIEQLKSEGADLKAGDVLRRVFAPDILGEKPVEKGEVAKLVKQILKS
jgi:uncharacterized protein YqeY